MYSVIKFEGNSHHSNPRFIEDQNSTFRLLGVVCVERVHPLVDPTTVTVVPTLVRHDRSSITRCPFVPGVGPSPSVPPLLHFTLRLHFSVVTSCPFCLRLSTFLRVFLSFTCLFTCRTQRTSTQVLNPPSTILVT